MGSPWNAAKGYYGKKGVPDDYRTPKEAWESISRYIPDDVVIWEPFYLDGKSGEYLEELGFDVIHYKNVDFFRFNLGDIVVSNPPYSNLKPILEKLVYEDDKPFILLMPVAKLHTQYFQKIFKGRKIQLIVPQRRINFIKISDGEEQTPKPLMDCYFYCYKMDLPQDIIFLSDPVKVPQVFLFQESQDSQATEYFDAYEEFEVDKMISDFSGLSIKKKRVLELFAGTGSVGKVCEELGYEVISLDLQNADINIDILQWDYKSAFPVGHFDLIWASPPCNTFSKMRNCHIGHSLTWDDIENDMEEIGLPILDRALEIINYFKPHLYFIENPQTGRMKDYMEGIPFYDVDYCKYANFGYKKRTRIWTNKKRFVPKVCNKDCGQIVPGTNRHETGIDRVKLAEKYRVPFKLIRELIGDGT